MVVANSKIRSREKSVVVGIKCRSIIFIRKHSAGPMILRTYECFVANIICWQQKKYLARIRWQSIGEPSDLRTLESNQPTQIKGPRRTVPTFSWIHANFGQNHCVYDTEIHPRLRLGSQLNLSELCKKPKNIFDALIAVKKSRWS